MQELLEYGGLSIPAEILPFCGMARKPLKSARWLLAFVHVMFNFLIVFCFIFVVDQVQKSIIHGTVSTKAFKGRSERVT